MAIALAACVSIGIQLREGGYNDGHSSMDYHRNRDVDHRVLGRLAGGRDEMASALEATALPAAGRSGAAAGAGGAGSGLSGRPGGGRIREGSLAAIWVSDRSPMYVHVGMRATGLHDVPGQDAWAASRPLLREAGGVDEFYIRALICSYPWPCSEALAVAWCESRFDPQAVSPDGANLGLFQINAVHRHRVDDDLSALLRADTNAAVAFAIWLDQGWGPWACKGVIR